MKKLALCVLLLFPLVSFGQIEPIECSCIKTLRAHGVNMPYSVDAVWYSTFKHAPMAIGSLAVFSSGGGHVGLVEEFGADSFKVYEGGSFNKVCQIREHWYKYDDKELISFFQPVIDNL